ncbi:hypoxanthine phosphoribosyltransferase [Zavarzinia sp. CC-PAN008]|uniref:hypoxanthine phosphoribosyltransferase n=1 Tax=Zavarzinia sp. CC-PAN008 TaxID=3243332 RepID=UPI003F7431BA
MTRIVPPSQTVSELYGADVIAARIEALAGTIVADLGTDLVGVAVLKGSFMYAADLLRALHRHGAHVEVDFMMLSSYGAGTESSGQVRVLRDITSPVEGRTVLLIDDILESGRTLAYAKDLLSARGAERVAVTVLLEKPGKRATQIDPEYVGFTCPDLFVVGYGMDCAHCFRELPFIGVMDP